MDFKRILRIKFFLAMGCIAYILTGDISGIFKWVWTLKWLIGPLAIMVIMVPFGRPLKVYTVNIRFGKSFQSMIRLNAKFLNLFGKTIPVVVFSISAKKKRVKSEKVIYLEDLLGFM